VQLDIQLGDGVFFIDGGFLKITHGSGFDHVADGETLDGLVLGTTAVAVDTANKLVVSTAVLVASVISSLAGLYEAGYK
jgi:hypothetical protein